MRHINFEEYVKENKRKYRQIRLLLRSESKAPRIKSPQRDLKARQELAYMTKRKWELWIESGKLEEIGERRYKVNYRSTKDRTASLKRSLSSPD